MKENERVQALCSALWVRRLFAFSMMALIASSLSQRYLGHVLGSPDLDFYDYYFAAQIVHENPRAPLYEGADTGNPQLKSAPANSALGRHAVQAGFTDTELYLYPPLLADTLQPLTHFSPQAAAMMWRLLNLALVFGVVVLLSRYLQIRMQSFEFLAILIAAYAFWPVHEAISLGQVSLVMLALWAVGAVAYRSEWLAISAIAFALATGLKVTPILLLPLFIIWKDKRWIAWYAGSLLFIFAGMLFVNGSANLRAYAHIMQSMSGLVPATQNKSIGSVVAWLYYRRLFTLQTVHAVLDSSSHGLVLAAKLISFGFYAFCLFLAWRRASLFRSRTEQASMLAIFALVTSVTSPVSWRHGYVIAIVPLVFMWSDALQTGATKLRVGLLTATTICVGSLVFDLAAQLPLPEVLKITAASIWVVATCALCIETMLDVTRRSTAHIAGEDVRFASER